MYTQMTAPWDIAKHPIKPMSNQDQPFSVSSHCEKDLADDDEKNAYPRSSRE